MIFCIFSLVFWVVCSMVLEFLYAFFGVNMTFESYWNVIISVETLFFILLQWQNHQIGQTFLSLNFFTLQTEKKITLVFFWVFGCAVGSYENLDRNQLGHCFGLRVKGLLCAICPTFHGFQWYLYFKHIKFLFPGVTKKIWKNKGKK